MLEDVTVCHPVTWVVEVGPNLKLGIAGYQHGILEAWLRGEVASIVHNLEELTVQMKRVLGSGFVFQRDLNRIALLEGKDGLHRIFEAIHRP